MLDMKWAAAVMLALGAAGVAPDVPAAPLATEILTNIPRFPGNASAGKVMAGVELKCGWMCTVFGDIPDYKNVRGPWYMKRFQTVLELEKKWEEHGCLVEP